MNTISLIMTKQEADIIEDIFNSDDDPQFTIISRSNHNEKYDCLEFTTLDDYIVLWHLARRLQLRVDYDDRIQELKKQQQQ